jgi:hypothetical protein
MLPSRFLRIAPGRMQGWVLELERQINHKLDGRSPVPDPGTLAQKG